MKDWNLDREEQLEVGRGVVKASCEGISGHVHFPNS